jgi:protein-S-isoprenylcysteine O-methyltransferase Ste14
MSINQTIRKMTNYLTQDLLGGPKIWKFSWIINFQKAGTFVFLGLLIWYYDNQTLAVWIYLAMHGSYGLVWILKDVSFPDPNWQKKITIAGGLMAFFGVLFWYWVIGWLLISGVAQPIYPVSDQFWFCVCISLCILGSVIMMVSDAQKYYTLKYHKGLITTGIHKYIRHPNYLGEMMIYASFALMTLHWLAFLIIGIVWIFIFIPNMIAKEKSLSRYPEWKDYKKKSGWVMPFI